MRGGESRDEEKQRRCRRDHHEIQGVNI